ncbi:MAG: hypothetical protein IT303_05580 [Dehalococcoidia bacterium]|nr:hypothetical protein [Dehalococcoidia bacterium]
MTTTEGPSRLELERSFARKDGSPDTRARDRVLELLDPGSFLEVGMLARDMNHGRAEKSPSDAVIAGYGTVGGHRVGVMSLDGKVLAGSGGHAAGAKQMRVLDEAAKCGFPIITFGEGGGGRIPDMMGSSLGYAGAIANESFLYKLAKRDRPFTLIACCMGEMYGDPSFKLGLSDFSFMARDACFAVSGPPLIKAALGEEITGKELGGPHVHEANGQVSRVEDSEADVIATVRTLLDFILEPCRPTADPDDRATGEIATILPASYNRAYDVKRVIRAIVDADCEPLYLWQGYGTTAVGCFARIGGQAVAVFANQPMVRGGVLDAESARKGMKFIQQCDRLRIPMLFLHDVPGFLIGRQAEADALLVNAMEYIRTLASATIPKVSVVLRKSYGLAYFAMSGPGWGADYVAALPSARIAFMGPEAGINLVYAKKLAKAANDQEREELLATLNAEWSERAEPWEAANLASVDDVIEPAETRATVIRALRAVARR